MKYAVVTPSYAPDFERCRLLNESIRRFVGGDRRHYILVEKRDLPLFSCLAGSDTTLIDVAGILPRWLRRVPGFDAGWFSFRTPPVRNWIVQQVVKLSAVDAIDEETLVFADSDTAFFRPFSVDWFERDGKIRLYRVPEVAKIPTHMAWHRAAGRLLGLPISDYFGATYIGHPTTWRGEVVRKLRRRIEQANGVPWAEAVCRRWQFSEYILYGIFVEHVLGMDRAGHFPLADPICHNSWGHDLDTEAGLASYFAEVKPHHVALMVSSKQGLPVSRYHGRYDALADAAPSAGAGPAEESPLVIARA